MLSFNQKISECNVCKHEYTSFHFEALPGYKIFVCHNCLETAKFNFIWVCLNCGKSYLRSKKLVMSRRNGYGIREASFLNESQLIQGIHMCLHCNPRAILKLIMEKRQGEEDA